MDKMPYYLVLGVFWLISLAYMIYPKTIYDVMPRGYRKLLDAISGVYSKRTPSYLAFMRVGGVIIFIISSVVLLGIFFGFLSVK